MYKVLIADDEPYIIELIKRIIDWEGLGLELAGQADNGIEAWQLMEELHPHILVTDIRMPGMDGLDLARRTSEEQLGTAIVIVSGHKHFDYACSAIRYGVEDYLLKPINRHALNQVLAQICMRLEARMRDLEVEKQQEEELDYCLNCIRTAFAQRVIEKGYPVESTDQLGRECQWNFKGKFLQAFALRLDNSRSVEGNEEQGQQRSFFLGKICEKTDRQLADADAALIWLTYREELLGIISGDSAEALNETVRIVVEEASRVTEAHPNYLYSIGLSGSFVSGDEFNDALLVARRSLYARLSKGTGRCISLEEPCGEMYDARRESEKILGQIGEALEIGHLGDLEQFVREKVRQVLDQETAELNKLFTLELIVQGLWRDLSQQGDLNGGREEPGQTVEEMYAGTAWSEIRRCLERVLTRWIGDCLTIKREQSVQPIRKAKQYIQQHYHENITLDIIARQVYLSPVYFSVMFKNEEGVNFSVYLKELRVGKAKELLMDDRLSVVQVANRVGYLDHDHFTKVFKKTVGITPNEYRKFNG